MRAALLQIALDLVFPPRCLCCAGLVEVEGALCGPCWRETPFITGLVCPLCGVPLPGEGRAARCDSCLRIARPWARGRAVLVYAGRGRDLVLKLKHADRHDIAAPAAAWMAWTAGNMIDRDTLLVPVPLHLRRLVRRRFNQSALLAQAIARATGAHCCTDALLRQRRTPCLDGMDRATRAATLDGAIAPNPRRAAELAGRRVVIVDDVMTTGATFAAATEAALAAGAQRVCVLALARVAKRP